MELLKNQNNNNFTQEQAVDSRMHLRGNITSVNSLAGKSSSKLGTSLGLFIKKKAKVMNLAQVDQLLLQLRLPLSLVLTPINIESEKKKFFDSDTYEPQFKYRIVKNKNKEILEKLRDLEEIDDVDPRISDMYIKLIKQKAETNELMNNAGRNCKFTEIAIEKFGMPSAKLFRNACRILKGKISIYNLKDDIKSNESSSLGYKEISQIIDNFFNYSGVEGWRSGISANITSNGVKAGVKTKILLMDKDISKKPFEIRKTIVHEIGTHVLRAENGLRSGYGIFSRANLNSYLDTEEGLALYNEELFGVLSIEALRKRALFVYLIGVGHDCTFRQLYNIALGFLKPKDAFNTVLRVKRGLGDGALSGIYPKDIVYFRGYRRVRRAIDRAPKIYDSLYAGKISLRQVEWVEEGLLPKPKYVPDKDEYNKLFKKLGI